MYFDEHKVDRILVLRPMEGKTALSTKGEPDKRLFTGENKMHAIMDPQTLLWSVKMDSGSVHQPLKQKFTSFGKLLEFVKQYLATRNIEVVEIKSANAETQ
jgi:hypothetical protein